MATDAVKILEALAGGTVLIADIDPLAIDGSLALSATTQTSDTAVTREQRRSRRKRAVRARTLSVKRMTKREIELGKLLYPESDHQRPSRREECIGGERPCPFVSCKHHLYVDVSPRTGAIKLNFPDLEVWEMNESCAIDVADRGGTTLEDVGAIMNLTRERIRQVEVRALAKLEALDDMLALRDYVDEGPVGKRRLPVIQPKVVGVKVAGVKVAGVKVAGVMGKSAAAVVASSASDDDDDDDDMDAGVHCDG